MKTVEIKVYEFSELDEKTKNKVIENEIIFWLEVVPFEDMSEDMQNAIIKCERLRTPWFELQAVWDDCGDFIMECINKYLYFKDGDIYISDDGGINDTENL
jgi:hypothetical protein